MKNTFWLHKAHDGFEVNCSSYIFFFFFNLLNKVFVCLFEEMKIFNQNDVASY